MAFSDYRPVIIDDFVYNLRSMIIPRFSKPISESDEHMEAKFMRSLPTEEREAIKKCFDQMDSDFSGSLNHQELEALLVRTYGMSPSEQDMTTLIAAVDKSGDGVVTLDEFIVAMATVEELKLAGDIFKWRTAFDNFDADGSGFVDGDELHGPGRPGAVKQS